MKRIYFDNKYGYGSLADCIVLQAVKDYTRSYRVFLRNPYNEATEEMMKECEEFFESGWFGKLCDLDPEELLYKLDKEVEAAHARSLKAADTVIDKSVLDAISDYEIWYRIYLKDPTDKEALEMMEDCEEFLIMDPKVRYYIKDPEQFLYELDQKIEEKYAGGQYGSDK